MTSVTCVDSNPVPAWSRSRNLGSRFDVWSLHLPVSKRTSPRELSSRLVCRFSAPVHRKHLRPVGAQSISAPSKAVTHLPLTALSP